MRLARNSSSLSSIYESKLDAPLSHTWGFEVRLYTFSRSATLVA